MLQFQDTLQRHDPWFSPSGNGHEKCLKPSQDYIHVESKRMQEMRSTEILTNCPGFAGTVPLLIKAPPKLHLVDCPRNIVGVPKHSSSTPSIREWSERQRGKVTAQWGGGVRLHTIGVLRTDIESSGVLMEMHCRQRSAGGVVHWRAYKMNFELQILCYSSFQCPYRPSIKFGIQYCTSTYLHFYLFTFVVSNKQLNTTHDWSVLFGASQSVLG